MATCFLQGGIGNLLFQFSTALTCGWETDSEVAFDVSNSDHTINIHRNFSDYRNNIFRNLNFKNLNLKEYKNFKESSFLYEEIKFEKNLNLIGYFQSEKYFKKYREKILKIFEAPEGVQEYIQKKYPELFNEIVCSIHVRRNDYLKYSKIHPPCSPKYYLNAMKMVPNKKFFVFSDDKEWCRRIFVHDKYRIIDEEDYVELYMMSLCQNNIIANSTFSWWGAWLNKNQSKIVVAPKRWFGPAAKMSCRDIVPDEWLRL